MGLPAFLIGNLETLQEKLKRFGMPVRWVRPGSIHLTLKFLGDIDQNTVGPISRALSAAVAGWRPLTLGVGGVGVFPGIKRPRVIWAGLREDTPGLLRLQASVEAGLETVGFAREQRPFKAHLTLGRVKGRIAPAQLLEAVEAFSDFRTGQFEVDGVTLFKSDLKPTGAVYTRLAHFDLGGTETGNGAGA
jgi:2'-5' RNA ligase